MSLQNQADVHDLQRLLSLHGTIEAYYNTACIDCKAKRHREIFVTAESLIFPCCWLGALYDSGSVQLLDVLADNGVKLDDLRVTASRDLDAVLSGLLFRHIVTGSSSLHAGKLRVCAATCGTEHRSFQAQFDAPESAT
jgi:hypothetical protein